MKVKNEMETVVRSELGRQAGEEKPLSVNALRLAIRTLLQRSGASALRCRCAWCRNDILALSLTKLPPCYCLSYHYGVSHRKIEEGALREIVSRSIRRIGGRPRHSWKEILPDENAVRLVDYRMRVGMSLVGPLLRRVPDGCDCEACRSDALAHCLNRLQPRYGVMADGKVRLQPHDLDFLRHEMHGAIAQSASVVARNPRHGDSDPLRR